MYNNIGEKVKGLAKVVAFLGILGSVIYGIVLIVQGAKLNSYYPSEAGSALIGTGFAVMIVGSLVSWISSWALYAIGDTNVKTTELYSKMYSEMYSKDSSSGTPAAHFAYTPADPSRPGTVAHTFRCDKCGIMISRYPCIGCGNDPEASR